MSRYLLHWKCEACGEKYSEPREKVAPAMMVVVCRKCGAETKLENGEKFRESFCTTFMEGVIERKWAEVMGGERD